MDLLRNKVVVITGGGSGIGRALALFIGTHGGRVVVNDLGTSPSGEGADTGAAEAVVREIRAAGGEAVASCDDVSTWPSAQRIIQAGLDSFGRVDAVVNSAGVMRHSAFENMPTEDFDLVLRTHLSGTFYVSRAAAPHFKAQGSGSYLHMTSTTGLIGSMGCANYGSAKAGIFGLSRLIALDMKRHGVRSNALAPSARSRQWERTNAFRQAEFAKPGANTDFRQFRSTQGTSEQVAPVAAFLLTDAASEITGQIIGVRGTEIYLYSQPRPARALQRSEGWTLENLAEQLTPALRSSFTPLETYGEVFSWPTL
ncbi:oxidoreductase, short chain dehydrogenase/reductase family protein [Acetobacteraceae bacterium AT-5844]|nr:oxidoreductase, short chain dehydrogenase/reductase family protein [Acetobacteraceae bacterium AT-5844]